MVWATVTGRGAVQLHEGTVARVPPERLEGAPQGAADRRPAREDAARAATEPRTGDANRLEGTVKDVSYIGVSTQYIIETAAGDELAVFAQNVGRGAEVGPGRRRVRDLWDPEHTFVITDTRRSPDPGGASMSNEPRGSRADIEALAFARGALTRRDFMRRAGLAGGSLAAANLLAACGGSVRRRRHADPARPRPRSSTRRPSPQTGTVLELAALHRREEQTDHPSIDKFDKQVQDPHQLPRGHQGQRVVLREGPGAAQGGPGHRPRHRHADRLDGRQVGALGYFEPLDMGLLPNVETNLVCRPTTAARSTPTTSSSCRGSRASPASPTTPS